MSLEQEVHKAAGLEADLFMADRLRTVHENREFVRKSIETARANCSYPLVEKGLKDVSVLLLGGTRVAIRTPSLRQDHSGKRGPKRKKRGRKGTGMYPVLEALGIRDGVSLATRSEVALLTVQASSYEEAAAMIERRGFSCDVSTLERIALTTAHKHMSLRDAAPDAAMRVPVAQDGPLVGKRVRVGVDGGRVRTRKVRKGQKTKKGYHRFAAPWREPRILVIDILDDEGKPDSLRLPLYDVVLGDADATFSLLIGYLGLLGAAHAEVVEFIADGADWIWQRVEQLVAKAEIPAEELVQVLDFYHAAEHLHKAVELCKGLSKRKRKKLYKELRHTLRHDQNGVKLVIKQLEELDIDGRKQEKMDKALAYFKKHTDRMRYRVFERLKLPIGSGQVESAVRRVINLRFKAPGSFWKEDTVNGLMHLRAYFKAGRWDELIKHVLTNKFETPSFQLLRSQERASVSPLRQLSKAGHSCADDYQNQVRVAMR